MDEALQQETERLVRSWMRLDEPFLRDYLVADVEDPRINVQSILSRHFLLATLFGNRFEDLMLHELRFAAAMNWLAQLAKRGGGEEERQAVLHALKLGADNAEGVELPGFIRQTFASLPARAGVTTVPNYLLEFLAGPANAFCKGSSEPRSAGDPGFNRFQELWAATLARESPPRLSVLEPACGSANDYRCLEAYGIARLMDYSGFDLCEKNVANARSFFPHTRFEVGNVFEIAAADQSFELCFVHDLLEHLSLDGLGRAVAELCRVTRHGLCVHFFQMDEMPDHVVRPVADYHINTLSLAKTEALFRQHGFTVQPLHIGSFLRQRVGCSETHNPAAYTFLAFRR
ncbi:MAG: methyltransferase domain-containing protein [Verrucomicrobia bacterium]|nr:methyltransferase domain-containing protein [Verrucomicrobiota bacterium]